MTLSREEIAVRVLCALAGRDGYGTDTATADAVIYADTLLRNLALTLTPAPVAPPAPTPAPEAGDNLSESAHEQIRRLAQVIMAEIPGEPSTSESAVNCAIRLLRKAYAPAPALSPPAPEAKRPTHVRTTREIPSWSGGDRIEAGVVLPVKEGPLPSGSVWVRVGSRPAFILHRDEWEPAPCPPPVAGSEEKDAAVRDVLAEREKQRAKWGDSHDDDHKHGELTIAAAELAVAGTDARVYNAADESDPWGLVRKHPNRRDQLVIAAALLLAEIERIDRAALSRPVRP